MIFAKLIDGWPRYAPRSVTIGHRQIINPPAETLRELGYLPVVETPAPETDELHYATPVWTVEGGEIRQSWEIKEVPPEPASLEKRMDQAEAKIGSLQQAALDI